MADYIKNIDQAERRVFTEVVEIREEGEENFIEGYAFVFGAEADLGSFTEEIAQGAADGMLNDDVRGLLNHEPNIVLGRTKAGTMQLTLDARGLKYRIKYNPKDSDHVNTREKILRGDISQSSFAFRVKDDKWETRNGKDHRIITKFSRLIDVSPVTYPAYPDATVGARSLDKFKNETRAMKPGDMVRPKKGMEHMDMHKGMSMEIVEISSEKAISVKMNGMVHKWYVASELEMEDMTEMKNKKDLAEMDQQIMRQELN
jgi:HK97 family phage prohead protease